MPAVYYNGAAPAAVTRPTVMLFDAEVTARQCVAVTISADANVVGGDTVVGSISGMMDW